MAMSSAGPAERSQAYVLLTPWALFDRTPMPDGPGRRTLSLKEPVDVPSGWPLFLAVPEGLRVDVEGRRLAAQPETNAFDLAQPERTHAPMACRGQLSRDRRRTRLTALLNLRRFGHGALERLDVETGPRAGIEDHRLAPGRLASLPLTICFNEVFLDWSRRPCHSGKPT